MTTKTLCGIQHIGRCTEDRVFTKEEATQQLARMGFQYEGNESAEWVNTEGVRGRLCWQPDYCAELGRGEIGGGGTRWWLMQPWGKGTILVLG